MKAMTVEELAERLKKYPKGTIVLCYEGEIGSYFASSIREGIASETEDKENPGCWDYDFEEDISRPI